MADAACALQSFSLPPEASDRDVENDSFAGMEGSISFGRFVSDSLDWGRWSSFRQNRYLEEAEKSLKPGSVAQMKAHFEAHFKRIAAMKAAAKAAEQANLNLTPGGGGGEGSSVLVQPEIGAESGAMDLQISSSGREECEGHRREGDDDQAVAIGDSPNPPLPSRREEWEEHRMVIDEDQASSISETSSKVSPTPVKTHEQERIKEEEAAAEELDGDDENKCVNGMSGSTPRSRDNPTKPPLQESSAANRKTPASDSKRKKQKQTSSFIISSKWPLFGQSSPGNPKRKENLPDQSSKRPSKDPIPRHSPAKFTPARAPAPFSSMTTPQSEAKRSAAPSHSRIKKDNVMSQSVSTSCWGSSRSAWKKPVQVVCSPFRFRSEERVEQRREFYSKLEEKLKAEKLEREREAKETSQEELKKLRQSLGFKARPMPGFYRRREKVFSTRPESENPPEEAVRSCFPTLGSSSSASKSSLNSKNKMKSRLNNQNQ